MKKKEFDVDLLRKLWCEENKFLYEVAEILNASQKTVQARIKEHNLVKKFNISKTGIMCSLYPKGKIYRLQSTHHKASKIMDWLYEDATIFLKRKKSKHQKWLLLWNRRYSPTSNES